MLSSLRFLLECPNYLDGHDYYYDYDYYYYYDYDYYYYYSIAYPKFSVFLGKSI